MKRHTRNRGAVLLIAVAIMAVLMLLALAFYSSSREEAVTAVNAENNIRAELAANGGFAIAQSHLRQDGFAHTTFTSLDHAWKTYFNGTWIGMKGVWAYPPMDHDASGAIDADEVVRPIPNVPFEVVRQLTMDKYAPATSPPLEGTDIYLPVVQDNQPGNLFAAVGDFLDQSDLVRADVFGIDAVAFANLTHDQFVDAFADHDNDNDGLRDSMWIPIPSELFFMDDGLDNDLDGWYDEGPDMATDGKDNNNDGFIDDAAENPELDPIAAANSAPEMAPFIYWGGDDGRDNDGDGAVDELDEARVFLTAPIAPLYDHDDNPATEPQPYPVPPLNLYRLDPDGGPPIPFSLDIADDPANPDVDRLDNDYTGVWNDRYDNVFVPADPLTNPNRVFSHRINTSVYFTILGADAQLTSTGEPVCEIIGRVAVLIKDESSKANINAGGGHTFNDLPAVDQGNIMRALNTGAGPQEYDLRAVPEIGWARAAYVSNYRSGAVRGSDVYDGATWQPAFAVDVVAAAPSPFQYDASLPGYGRVDDNGNALWLAMNGFDDDGDGLIDEGLNPFLPNYFLRFEGIDEPREYRMFRPHRNLLAETDGINNNDNPLTPNDDGLIDEAGELADDVFRDRDQLKRVADLSPTATALNPNYSQMENFTTAFSEDANLRYQHRAAVGANIVRVDPPVISGLKMDYNYASAYDIALAMARDWAYVPNGDLPQGLPSGAVPNGAIEPEERFAAGLRQEAVTYTLTEDASVDIGILGSSTLPVAQQYRTLPYDQELRAYQLAASVTGQRDIDHTRTEVTTTVEDDWYLLDVGGDETRQIRYTMAGVESIRINEMMVRPVRRIEAEADIDTADETADPPDGLVAPAFDSNAFAFVEETPGTPYPDFSVQAEYYADASDPGSPIHTILDGDGAMGPTRYVSTTTPGSYMEFRFEPSSQLPPGLYYLMVNTRGDDGDPTVVPVTPPDLPPMQYAVKYVNTTSAAGGTFGLTGKAHGDTSIMDDETAGFVPWQTVEHIGYDGTVFLHTSAVPDITGTYVDGYLEDHAFTVEIPPYDPTNQTYLHVAVLADLLPGEELSINFFDFSQEPDHEWVEIVNIADQGGPIDLSGWQLEIGADVMLTQDPGTGAITDSTAPRQFTIPDGTFIAPGGSLILGFSKYDLGAPQYADIFTGADQGIDRNGMGLARTVGAGITLDNITAPFLPTFNPATGLPIGPSVFIRGVDEDFMDQNWNGVDDRTEAIPGLDALVGVEDGVVSTLDASAFAASATVPVNANAGARAFDRIVQLESFSIDRIQGRFELATLLLGGGFLPNYPEENFTDDDGDAAILSNDRIDNDGDGSPNPTDEDTEGIDEGRHRLTRWRYGVTQNDAPAGSYSEVSMTYRGIDINGNTFEFSPGDYSLYEADPDTYPQFGYPRYLGVWDDPPEWKALVEERFFPGDNVIVTLYEGPAYRGSIADRVTYTQKDVENRNIDDGVSIDVDGDGTADRDPLNVLYDTFWPDNTMGVDFYRTLERKHPLYPGDKHGTSNRWEAMDGNYDDWDSGASVFALDEAGVEMDYSANPRYTLAYGGSPLGMSFVQRRMENPFGQFGLGTYDVNMYDPTTYEVAQAIFAADLNADLTPDRLLIPWIFEKDGLRNASLGSPGDLALLPHFSMVEELGGALAAGGFDARPLSRALLTEVLTGMATMDAAVANPAVNVSDLQAIMAGDVHDSEVFSVAQAEFYPLFPSMSDVTIDDTLATWSAAGTAPQAWTPVFLFALDPAQEIEGDVEPYPLGADPGLPATFAGLPNYPVQMNFLCQTPPLDAGLAVPDLYYRWPLPQRAVMYASANPTNFDVQASQRPRPGDIYPAVGGAAFNTLGSEALFVWDANDGLQNGEYDVYVVVNENVDLLRSAHIASGGGILTAFGEDFVDVAAAVEPGTGAIDVEVFTDRNGDRRVWYDGGVATDGFPQPLELDRAADPLDPALASESFGIREGLTPGRDGFVHYGIVEVQNNYLALFVRNWSPPGRVTYISRIILTPSGRTAGRVNINTSETGQSPWAGAPGPGPYAFNALSGVPGILAIFDPSTGLGQYPPDAVELTDASPEGATWRANAIGRAAAVSRLRPPQQPVFDGGGNLLFSRSRAYGLPADLGVWLASADPLYPRFFPQLTQAGQDGLDYTLFADAAYNDPIEKSALFEDIFNETLFRFTRSSNMLSTHSDVFEIIVTAQSGVATDMNGDGVVDYRTSDERPEFSEFVPTAEKKLRMVYRR